MDSCQTRYLCSEFQCLAADNYCALLLSFLISDSSHYYKCARAGLDLYRALLEGVLSKLSKFDLARQRIAQAAAPSVVLYTPNLVFKRWEMLFQLVFKER